MWAKDLQDTGTQDITAIQLVKTVTSFRIVIKRRLWSLGSDSGESHAERLHKSSYPEGEGDTGESSAVNLVLWTGFIAYCKVRPGSQQELA